MIVHVSRKGAKKVSLDPSELIEIQQKLGLSDNKMAQSLGITRQTLSNWKSGKCMPQLAKNAVCWMIELRRIDPANDNLPQRVKFTK